MRKDNSPNFSKEFTLSKSIAQLSTELSSIAHNSISLICAIDRFNMVRSRDSSSCIALKNSAYI